MEIDSSEWLWITPKKQWVDISNPQEAYISTCKYTVLIGKSRIKDDFDRNNEGIISIYIIDSQRWWSYGVYRGDGLWMEGIHIDRE